MMTTEHALTILRSHEADLRARGFRRAGIFGSVARNEARPSSDLDVLIEIDAAKLTVFDYVAIKRAVAGLFPGKVDVVNAGALKPRVGQSAKRDTLYAF